MTHAHGGNNMNAEDMLGQSILADVRAACSLESNDNKERYDLMAKKKAEGLRNHSERTTPSI